MVTETGGPKGSWEHLAFSSSHIAYFDPDSLLKVRDPILSFARRPALFMQSVHRNDTIHMQMPGLKHSPAN